MRRRGDKLKAVLLGNNPDPETRKLHGLQQKETAHTMHHHDEDHDGAKGDNSKKRRRRKTPAEVYIT
jgi:hypothetical protein